MKSYSSAYSFLLLLKPVEPKWRTPSHIHRGTPTARKGSTILTTENDENIVTIFNWLNCDLLKPEIQAKTKQVYEK